MAELHQLQAIANRILARLRYNLDSIQHGATHYLDFLEISEFRLHAVRLISCR